MLTSRSEYGDQWHKDAIFEKRQNAYDDFIAAAECLIEKKYTSPSKWVAGHTNALLSSY